MRKKHALVLAAALVCAAGPNTAVSDCSDDDDRRRGKQQHARVDLGPRPGFLVDGMDEGPLKEALEACAKGPFHPTDFSIGHRGAALQFPEHTQ